MPGFSFLLKPCKRLFSYPAYLTLGVLLILGGMYAGFSHLFFWLGLSIIASSSLMLWHTHHKTAKQLNHWTQAIRASEFDARFSYRPRDEFLQIFQDLQHVGNMLQSLSRDAENQVQIHTTHVARKTLSLSILYDVASSINMSDDVNSLLSRFLHTITELIDAHAAVAYLVKGNDEVEPLTHINLHDEIIDAHANLCLKSDVTFMHDNFGLLQVNLIACEDDIQQRHFNGEDIDILVVPLQYHGQLLGSYNFYIKRNSLVEFDDYSELFTSIGRHLGAAIEKAYLDEESVSLSIMRERTHIANELHDSLAQTLTSIRFQIRVLDETLHQGNDEQIWAEMEKIEASISEAHTEIRELIAHFRSPTVLVDLIGSVEQTIDRFRQVNDEIQVFFHNEWTKEKLPAETEFHILRIIQESLTNIRKHSDALNVRIMMNTNANGECTVLIEDDGVGFSSPQTSEHRGEHIGLSIMSDRAKRFGGSLTIESEPGEGTQIILEFTIEETPDKSTQQIAQLN